MSNYSEIAIKFEKKENTDGGEFMENGVGDWEYDHTEDESGNVID